MDSQRKIYIKLIIYILKFINYGISKILHKKFYILEKYFEFGFLCNETFNFLKSLISLMYNLNYIK